MANDFQPPRQLTAQQRAWIADKRCRHCGNKTTHVMQCRDCQRSQCRYEHRDRLRVSFEGTGIKEAKT